MGDNSDPEDLPEGQDERDARIAKRISAKLYRQDGDCVPVIIENLSRYGAQVESDIPVEVGEAIRLTIDPLGDFEGVVRWCRDNHFGVHTIDTINISVLHD